MKRKISDGLKKLADFRSSPTVTPRLYGREIHLERIEAALRAVDESGQSTLMLLQSPAGSGKTRLLLETATVAKRLGFAVVDRFVDGQGQVHGSTSITPAPSAADRQNRASAPDADRLTRLTGQIEARLHGHVRHGPLLVVLDDTHRVDLLVLRALSALVRKLGDLPVLWVFALQPQEADCPNNMLVQELARSRTTVWLPALEPLDDDAVAGLIGDLLTAKPDDDVRALGEWLGGTPQTVVDLVRGLVEENCLRITDDTAGLANGPLTSGIASAVASEPDAHLPRPFLRLVHERLARLAPGTQQSLQVAAVLGASFAPCDLAEMLDKSPAALLTPLKEALDAGLLTYGAEEFAFRNEPIWRAVVGTVPPLMRSLLHQQAADMILARKGGSTDAAALHLVHCRQAGDSRAVSTIRAAAEKLLPASPGDAAALALRGLEAADRGRPEHIRLAITATIGLLRHGNLQQAIDVAESVLACSRNSAEDGFIRPLYTWLATALLLRGDARTASEIVQDASALWGSTAALQEGEPSPVLLQLDVLSHTGEISAAAKVAEHVITTEGTHNNDTRAAALNLCAMARWREGRIEDAFDTLNQAIALHLPLTSFWQAGPLWTKAWMLTRVRRLDEAMATVATIQHTIDSEHNRVLAALPLALSAWVHFARGDLATAEADAEAGIRASQQVQMPLWEPHLYGVLVAAALRRGELATADDGLAQLDSARAQYEQPWSVMCYLVTAQVRAAQRREREALEVLRPFIDDPDKLPQLLLEDPSATAWCVRTALAADDKETAALIASTAARISSVAHAYPAVTAAAAHSRALLTGDIKSLEGVAEHYGDPWAAASATEDLGVLLHTDDREEAIRALNTAMTAYRDLGAIWDEARVRKRLRRLGVRRRHWKHVPHQPQTGWDSLTRTEEKVALLVARGLTNRQVASELFVSPHTVGFHLRQIYRKLTIQSRVDLARIAFTR
ncbi:LuxR C-terminal-related transcriptional regulator [Streptomyces sp. NBC_00878]|uniref:helix-turn-helix transcriptional regulator n=1 Tax=Streptomyces sp. NBC_00878 TaxID=2975854 RepID=UPI00225977FB|nr:LuxR C-terminal-related transcriptional regulator [Streptomyces sp. NBC_00878]MCX4904533.1 LuxR C-terminal-related transcriptional regulator [Streptomyces sp. NBC_00878]